MEKWKNALALVKDGKAEELVKDESLTVKDRVIIAFAMTGGKGTVRMIQDIVGPVLHERSGEAKVPREQWIRHCLKDIGMSPASGGGGGKKRSIL